MSKRPEHDPKIIVAPYQPEGASAAKLFPPILIVLLGVVFLAYRSRSADWRGISALFERRPPAAVPAAPAPPPEALAKAEIPMPAATEPIVESEKSDDKKKKKDVKDAQATVEPIDEIEQQAEKTRARIAKLEKAKELAARKLDESADDRERADRLARRNQRGLRGAVAPQDLEKMLRAQQKALAQLMDQMQRRQMAWMNQRQREFFGPMGPHTTRAPGFPMPAPFPGFAPMLGPEGQPLPGNGVRFREFRGPGGHRFEMHWEGRTLVPQDDRDEPPPPPVPRLGPPGGPRFD